MTKLYRENNCQVAFRNMAKVYHGYNIKVADHIDLANGLTKRVGFCWVEDLKSRFPELIHELYLL